jgi:hypothetical protein
MVGLLASALTPNLIYLVLPIFHSKVKFADLEDYRV